MQIDSTLHDLIEDLPDRLYLPVRQHRFKPVPPLEAARLIAKDLVSLTVEQVDTPLSVEPQQHHLRHLEVAFGTAGAPGSVPAPPACAG